MKGLVKIGNVFHFNMRHQGEHRRRTTKTGHGPTAERIAIQWKARSDQLQTGQVILPPGADPWRFIFKGVTESTGPPDTEKPPPMSILELAERFGQQLGPPKISPAYAKTQKIYLGHFKEIIQRHRTEFPELAEDWTLPHGEKYHAIRLDAPARKPPKSKRRKRKQRKKRGVEKVRPITVAKELATLRKMFEYARRQGWIRTNPIRDLEPIPDNAPDATFRTLDEIIALEETGQLDEVEARRFRRKMLLDVGELEELKLLLEELAQKHYLRRPGDLDLFIRIAADCGMRLGEIASLTTLDLVLDPGQETGSISARSRKGSRKVTETVRHIPIHGDLVVRLAEWVKGLEGRRLFYDAPPATFRAHLYRVLDAATKGTKFEGLRPHLLRHALRTNLYESGVDEKAIDAILGHSTEEMGDRYRHIRAARLAKAMKDYVRKTKEARDGMPPANGDDTSLPADGFHQTLVG